MHKTSSSNRPSNHLQAATDLSNNKPVTESDNNISPTMHNRYVSNTEWQTWQDIKPVMECVSEGDDKVITLLSKSDPMLSLTSINSAGQTVLHLAAEKNQYQVIESLMKLPCADKLLLARDKAGSTPLMMAAELGQVDAVKSLLKHASAKAQVLAASVTGDNALMMAISAGHLDVVELLLQAGLAREQINTINKAGSSAISLALQQRHQSINALLKIASLL